MAIYSWTMTHIEPMKVLPQLEWIENCQFGVRDQSFKEYYNCNLRDGI